MKHRSFTEYFHLLLTGSEPTEDQRFFLDRCWWRSRARADADERRRAHDVAADPDSLQGAVAAGILGCEAVILGTAEECAAARARSGRGGDPGGGGARAGAGDPRRRGEGPGFGHPSTGRSTRAPSTSSSPTPVPSAARTCGWRSPSATAWQRRCSTMNADADRGRHARPRLLGGDREGGRFSPARPVCSPTWPRSRAADRVPDGGG